MNNSLINRATRLFNALKVFQELLVLEDLSGYGDVSDDRQPMWPDSIMYQSKYIPIAYDSVTNTISLREE